MVEILWDTLKDSLTDHFDGTGVEGTPYATHSQYKIHNVLMYNDQDVDLEDRIQYNYPLVYVEFNPNIEINEMTMSLQWASVEFTLKLHYEAYNLMEENLGILKFGTELTNFTETLTRFTNDFNLGEVTRISQTKGVGVGNIWTLDTTFKCNVLDKSMYNYRYVEIKDFDFELNLVPIGYKRLIEAISGGDPSSSYERLIGLLYDYTNDMDISIDNIKIGGGSPSDVADIIIKCGTPSD